MAALKGRRRQPKPRKPPEAGISRSFGWVAALGVVLVIGGLVGLLYVGFATLTTMTSSAGCCWSAASWACCRRCSTAVRTSSGWPWSSRR